MILHPYQVAQMKRQLLQHKTNREEKQIQPDSHVRTWPSRASYEKESCQDLQPVTSYYSTKSKPYKVGHPNKKRWQFRKKGEESSQEHWFSLAGYEISSLAQDMEGWYIAGWSLSTFYMLTNWAVSPLAWSFCCWTSGQWIIPLWSRTWSWKGALIWHA